MLEKQFNISKLITAYLQGRLSASQQAELNTWLAENPENKAFFDSFSDEELLGRELTLFEAGDEQATWSKTQAILNKKYQTTILWPKLAVAAAAIAAIAFGLWFFNKPHFMKATSESNYARDIKPGGNRATITLADGKVINLDSTRSNVVVQDSVKTVRATTLIASTPMGGTYSFTLPDGTVAYLNAASSIKFPSRFTEKQRIIQIEGEVYFEVAKDKAHPFIVESEGQQVEVLGTHFNVNSYANEPLIATTLIEGSVSVTAGKNKRIIRPGEQVLNNGTNIRVAEANLENVMDWRNGDFFLNHVDFKTAMRKIARWYNVEVFYDETVPDNIKSGGWISRDKPLSVVLKSIEDSGLAKFRIEGQKIYVFR
ncbi:FecR family protein [Pedobacter steynii]|uniref:FecR protein n=1 Tax=Pedobacter steynii TaxID=430522 RepID=A0A1D7QL49_9SPHI|nr:FecR family protein [Pedobacter steynii]AOM79339.1 hypothetical protein BFS30_20505 [Pedobacter steynii]